jgi:hypothetical protein
MVEICELHALMAPYQWKGKGRKPLSRLPLAKAFVAKMVWNLATTEDLISFLQVAANTRRLCGWDAQNDIPDRATFSRAFEQFSLGQLPQLAQSQLIKTHLADLIIGHISIDAAAISARESVAKKEPPADPAQSKSTKSRTAFTISAMPHMTLLRFMSFPAPLAMCPLSIPIPSAVPTLAHSPNMKSLDSRNALPWNG